MKKGRPKAAIILSKDEHERLKSIAGSRSLPYGVVIRARIIIMAASGTTNKMIVQKIGYSTLSVGLLRKRYLEQGPKGFTMNYPEAVPGQFVTNKWPN